MDYEQKYKEALERARKINNGKDVDVEAGTTTCEYIFPELKESEDERIRKALIDGVRQIRCKNEITQEQMLAWLEKQKDAFENGRQLGIMQEQARQELELTDEKQKYDRMKPIYDAKESFESALEKAWNDYHNGYENVDKLEDDYVECAHAKGFREGYLFGIEKQKEQKKPTLDDPDLYGDWDKDLLKEIHSWLGNLDGKYTPYTIDDIKLTARHFVEWQKQKEQKPIEWSEDFEENIRNLLHNKLTGHSKDGTMTWTTFIDDKTLKDIVSGIWFYVGKEALKYPNKELNVAEWSEEDERKRDGIIQWLRNHQKLFNPKYDSLSIESIDSLIDWFKSIHHGQSKSGDSTRKGGK